MNANRILAALLLSLLLSLLLAACGKSEPPGEAEPAAHDEQEGHGHDDGDKHEDGDGKEAAHAEEEGHVELSAKTAQAAGIELDTAGPARIRELLPLYGTVQPNAERVREVTARYPGVIRSVTKKIGDTVRQGETLATVESDESLRSYAVTSPLSGVITARNANPGEKAGETALLTVADLSSVWVELSLFPRDISKIHIGQMVRVKSVDGGLAADGKIVYIAPLGQSSSQTVTARVLLDNTDKRWPPGLYVTGEVALSETEVAVAVKSTALQTVENRSVVFVQSGDGFKPQPVALGRADGDYTEIRSGLAIGSRYAAANSFVLKSELGKGDAGHDH